MMLTKFLAKLLGLWLVIVVLCLFANRDAAVALTGALPADAPLTYVTGIFTMVIGIAMVVGHNRWSGGAVPVIVTVYGWVALFKGVALVVVPAAAQAQFYAGLHFAQFYPAYLLVALAIGAYLIYAGFTYSLSSGKLNGGS